MKLKNRTRLKPGVKLAKSQIKKASVPAMKNPRFYAKAKINSGMA